jgi:hypothetical protein
MRYGLATLLAGPALAINNDRLGEERLGDPSALALESQVFVICRAS